MTAMTWVYLLIGLVVLVFGADWLVKGASRIAAKIGISPLVIGLTVVAFGTSAPEMAVSVGAALKGLPDMALGNVVGSNIFNVLGILGLAALAAPLLVNRQLIRLDVPVMIGISLVAYLLCLDGKFSRFEGAMFFVGLIGYTGWLIYEARREKALNATASENVELKTHGNQLINIGLVIIGLVALVIGARLLVSSATEIAQAFGVSELVIGLTIVAVGTSLPELATSVIATLKGERDIAIGNVVGSNIFNLLGVLGLSSILSPNGINVAPVALSFDLPVMLAVAVVCFPIFITGAINRLQGGMMLFYYVAYTALLVLTAREHEAVGTFQGVMVYAVMPLTLVYLTVALWKRPRGVFSQSKP
jgi:cation:H+ antiporter